MKETNPEAVIVMADVATRKPGLAYDLKRNDIINGLQIGLL